jgi:hypothetical protein
MSDSDLPDEQDQAEAFDEDNFNLDGSGDDSGEFKTFEELPDVFDVTRALGDADVDEALVAEDADEIEDEPEDNELDDDDDLDEVDGIAAQAADEAEVEYVESLDDTSSNAGRAARHLESRGELSNEDLEELGYRDEEGTK